MVHENFNRWLKSSFICERCGRTFYLMTFGYGTVRCPGCYEGDGSFMRLDEGYWLNRLVNHFITRGEVSCFTG
jgi:hypothetical protein